MTTQAEPAPLKLGETRFSRLEEIEWWDQARLKEARVLVAGAGALGNEILKNLALLGVGNVIIADMDSIEESNLSRSVLYREGDTGQPKAERAAAAVRDIYGEMRVFALTGNLLAAVGLGCFRWADVVLGAVDNREARVFINTACAQVGRPWVDGGIDVLYGIARGFRPPATACYECTMSSVDWELLNKRRSCSLLARRAAAQRGTPTTPTTASIIGATQVQEAVKLLHGRESLMGRGWIFDGENFDCYTVSYPVDPQCGWHEPPNPVETHDELGWETDLGKIWDVAAARLGGLDALDLSRELVQRARCPGCGDTADIYRVAESVTAEEILCPRCGVERQPDFFHSITEPKNFAGKTPRTLGLPRWDILWARRGETTVGIELSADAYMPNATPKEAHE
jgi:molybdopterin/thiamine biosynthesis adenylyltransferase